jgi:hypothetical protein
MASGPNLKSICASKGESNMIRVIAVQLIKSAQGTSESGCGKSERLQRKKLRLKE